MSNSNKPLLLYILLLILSIAGFLLFTVIMKINYKQLLMEKDQANQEIITAIQEQKKLNAIYQDLTSEDYIVPYAQNNLSLIKNFSSSGLIKLSEERIQFIEEALSKKYE